MWAWKVILDAFAILIERLINKINFPSAFRAAIDLAPNGVLDASLNARRPKGKAPATRIHLQSSDFWTADCGSAVDFGCGWRSPDCPGDIASSSPDARFATVRSFAVRCLDSQRQTAVFPPATVGDARVGILETSSKFGWEPWDETETPCHRLCIAWS